MDRYELRRLDYGLTRDQRDLQAAYRDFFTTHCPIDTVRASESTGFDKSLWERLCATGATTMAAPIDVGGDGATMVDLVLVAEELGRALAPVPWIDHVCATRLLARLGVLEVDDPGTAEFINGIRIAALDPQLEDLGARRLIPSGTIADHIIVRRGAEIVHVTYDNRPPLVENIGCLPMAWIDVSAASTSNVVGSGAQAIAEYSRALDEWRLLTAAALAGLVEQSMMLAAEFAKSRFTFGVPIASLQGISHPLARAAVMVQGGRNLTRRAAWFHEYEPDERPELAPAAFHFMAEGATTAASSAAHVQGGLGITVEAPSAAYYLRARGWALAAGDPAATATQVIDRISARQLRARTPNGP
ncbi:acyl-CoA dehydrogenase family protein [Mycobacterium intracellulare]|uniref:acyl-CoA dehydrogenase family protein n=1 Tax=Mycobacterium intracellulare TaxID=1767 RepID=UPI001EEE7461|nr:acyl-CoA dehydrogenase family protein [Mycobacterium intracellulare]MEE3751435.1 acyl-CoA dehydrogenase family protein [Mycobacterium intracellulare]